MPLGLGPLHFEEKSIGLFFVPMSVCKKIGVTEFYVAPENIMQCFVFGDYSVSQSKISLRRSSEVLLG